MVTSARPQELQIDTNVKLDLSKKELYTADLALKESIAQMESTNIHAHPPLQIEFIRQEDCLPV